MVEGLDQLKLLLFDVDGVLTDGGIIYESGGVELKRFDVQDGFGITMAKAAGFRVGIITGRKSEMVERRAQELGIDVLYQGYFDKLDAYTQVKKAEHLKDAEIAYMGDDILDMCVLERVAFALAPANARPEVRDCAQYVTHSSGGHGAVREAIEFILREQGRLQDIIGRFACGDVPAGSPG